MYRYYYANSLSHHGIKGMKWGIRRYQNYDGTLTNKGKKHKSETDDKRKGLSDKQKKAIKTAVIVGAAFVGTAALAYGGKTAAQYLSQNKIAKEDVMRFIDHQKNLEGSFYRKPSEGAIKANIKSETKRRFDLVRKGQNPNHIPVNAKPSDYGYEKWERVGEASSLNAWNFDKFDKRGKIISPLKPNHEQWVNAAKKRTEQNAYKNLKQSASVERAKKYLNGNNISQMSIKDLKKMDLY